MGVRVLNYNQTKQQIMINYTKKEKMIKSAKDSYAQDFNKLEELGYQVEFRFFPSRGHFDDILEVVLFHKNGDYLSREEEVELGVKYNFDIRDGEFQI
tara:strand:- start:158 stop:451 length:294 start_codon:yes stop_codon:yes gene_type:complete